MRFHMGVSFSWRTIKKYLIPIILGAIAVFGFKFINDNKDDLTLGFLKVNALENYDSSYTFNYPEFSFYENYHIDNSNHTIVDVLNYLKSLDNLQYDYTFYIQTDSSSVRTIYFQFYINNVNYTFNVFGTSPNKLSFLNISDNNFSNFIYEINTYGNYLSDDIFNNTTFTKFTTCITTTTCSGAQSSIYTYNLGYTTTTFDNSSSNEFQFYNGARLIYYSTRDLIVSNNYNTNNADIFYKKLYINDHFIDVGTKFLTYDDIKNYVPDDPVPDDPVPDDPVPDDVEHKPLYNKIYWFDDNTTDTGILSSIYILLFLYCITMILLKILTIIKNKRW